MIKRKNAGIVRRSHRHIVDVFLKWCNSIIGCGIIRSSTVVLFLMGACCAGISLSAQDNRVAYDIPNHVVRVGMYPMDGYHNYIDGKISGGFGYDYFQHLRRYVPWVYEYSGQAQGWPETMRMLEDGKLDMVSNVRKTPEREAKFAFSKYPMGESSTILTVRKGNTRFYPGDYKNWDGIRVGILKGNHWAEKFSAFAQKNGFTFHARYYDNTEKMIQDLQLGSIIDAALSNNMRQLQSESILEMLDSAPYFIAVRKDKPQLLAELDSAMSQLNSNLPTLRDRLWTKYFSGGEVKNVTFTEKELDFISRANAEGHKFLAVLNPDRQPLSYFADGKNQGLVKEIADEIVRRSKLQIEFLPVQTPEEYRKACQDPKVDFIFDMPADFREAEKRGMLQTPAYITLAAAMLKNRKAGERLHDIALVEHYRVTDKIRPHLPKDAVIHFCKTTAEAVAMVKSGRCDATCLHVASAELAIKDDYQGQMESVLMAPLNLKLSVGIRDSRNPLLHTILYKAVNSLGDEYIMQKRLKYNTGVTPAYSLARFLHQHPLVMLGIPCLILLGICIFLLLCARSRKKDYLRGLIFKNLPFRYFIADAKGKLIQYNYGNAPDAPKLQSLDDVKDADVREPIRKIVVEVLKSGETHEQIYTDSGRTRISLVSPLPQNIFGRPTVIGVSRDITDLQQTRDEARKNEEYFRMTLRSIGDGVIATDRRGNIVMLNSVAETMMGVKLEDTIGKPHTDFFKIVDTLDDTALESPVLRVLRTDKTVELANHTDLVSADGQHRYHIADSSAPIHNAKDEIIGAILVFRDVTEEYENHKRTELELSNWEAASRIASIYHFTFDANTRKVVDCTIPANIWPTRDGRMVPSSEWICREDLPKWQQAYTDVAEGLVEQSVVSYRTIQKDKMRYFQGYMRIGKEKGLITGLVQEITSFEEVKQQQSALQTLFDLCINTMPISLFMKAASDDFRYLVCNQNAVEKTFALSMDQVIGHTDAEICCSPDDAKRQRDCDLQVMSGGKSVEFHESIHDGNGVIHHYRTVKTPAVNIDGKPILVGMAIDETEEYQQRETLDRMLDDWETIADAAKLASYRVDRNLRVLSKQNRINDFWPTSDDGIPLSEELYLRKEDVAPYREMYADVFSGRKNNATMLCHVPQADGTRYLRLFIKRDEAHPDEISELIQDVTEQIKERTKREAFLSMWTKVIDSLPVLFFVQNADDEFRYLQANRSFFSTMGLSEESVIGKKECEFLPNRSDASQTGRAASQVMESGESYNFTEQLEIGDGTRRQFQTVKLPAVNDAGQRILICMAQDITDAQQSFEVRRIISSAFETLFSSDDLPGDLRIILKSICEFIGFPRAYIACIDEKSNGLQILTTHRSDGAQPMFDLRNFRIEHASTLPWYKKMLGSVRDETFYLDFSNRDDYEMAKELVPSILSKSVEFDVRGVYLNYVFVDGKPWGNIGFIITGTPLKKLSENEQRLLKLTSHIVELAVTRKRMVEDLKDALNNALAADKAKSYFLSSMSHEIRTPLNAVIGFTDLLKDDDLDHETRNEYLEAVSSASHALLALLSDILDLSKLTSGNMPSHPVKTDIHSIVNEMKSVFDPAAQKKSLDLKFQISDMPELYLDQPHLRQILFNLIGNAIKFTNTGSVTVDIHFEQNAEATGKLTLQVIDTGIGIVQEDRMKMFEPFVQLSRMRGTNASGTGTGLGLAIIKKIVEQDGGTLSLESEVGVGSTFTIEFTAVPVHLIENAEPTAELKKTEFGGQNPRILVVDDSEIALDILCRMLQTRDIPYEKALSANTALEFVKKGTFDIVLTDYLMPEMSGAELAAAIRILPNGKKIRILVMSTENESVMYDKSLFDQVLLKPIARKALYNEIFGDRNGK